MLNIVQFNGVQPVRSNQLPVALDAFGRFRVSSPVAVFDDTQLYGNNALVWETAVVGGGSIANLLNESSVSMTTGNTTSGSSCVRQTRQCFRYQPGRAQMPIMSFNMGPAYDNVRTRIGQFDADNGLFIERVGTSISLVIRSSVSGSPVSRVSAQADWNLDKLNGSGASGITLNSEVGQIFFVDYQWLAEGVVRMGFFIGGTMVYAHEFEWANTVDATTVYMTTAMLPLRLEVTNVGTASGVAVLKHVCCVVLAEGSSDAGHGFQFSATNPVLGSGAAVSVNTRRPVLSIRPRTVGPNGNRNKAWVIPKEVQLVVTTNSALLEVVVNGVLTGSSFQDYDAARSLCQYDVSATGITDGLTILKHWVPEGSGSSAGAQLTEFFRNFALVYTGLGNVQDTLTIVATSWAGNSSVRSKVTWQEFY